MKEDSTLKWDTRFFKLAASISEWSKDPSTKVGCIIIHPDRNILSTGYNGFPKGISDTEERLADRDIKYDNTIHAEVNAIFNAARNGVSLQGSTLYVVGLPVCSLCANSIIQVGIERVCMLDYKDPRWLMSTDRAKEKLTETHVQYDVFEKEILE